MTHTDEACFYRQRARYYDPIYTWKDYASEAKRLRELLAAEGVGDGSRIVEAACGTGSYLVNLRQWYEVEGFDLSAEMLEIAKTKLPAGVRLWQADMTEVAVDEPYDALLCLFSSIGYIHTADRLRAAADCFARAVRPGGVIIIEPWITPEDYTAGLRSMRMYDGDDFKLCRITVSERETREEADLAVMDFHWIALEAGETQADHFTERHEMWLCPRQLMLDIFNDAGFEARFEPDGLMPKRGLVIGRRRSEQPGR